MNSSFLFLMFYVYTHTHIEHMFLFYSFVILHHVTKALMTYHWNSNVAKSTL